MRLDSSRNRRLYKALYQWITSDEYRTEVGKDQLAAHLQCNKEILSRMLRTVFGEDVLARIGHGRPFYRLPSQEAAIELFKRGLPSARMRGEEGISTEDLPIISPFQTILEFDGWKIK